MHETSENCGRMLVTNHVDTAEPAKCGQQPTSTHGRISTAIASIHRQFVQLDDAFFVVLLLYCLFPQCFLIPERNAKETQAQPKKLTVIEQNHLQNQKKQNRPREKGGVLLTTLQSH